LPGPEQNVIECYVATSTSAPPGPSPAPWPVIITEWALDSYLTLKHGQVFTPQDYRSILRPDVELLKLGLPSPDPKFTNSKFWGPAKQGNVVLHHGHKMKWHQMGPGQVQLRLPVMSFSRSAFLCEAYVKASSAVDQRKMARFKTHMNLISQGRYVYRGAL
jgi:hypothetical protein